MNEARVLKLFKTRPQIVSQDYATILAYHKLRGSPANKILYIHNFGIIQGTALNVYLNKIIKQYE